MRDVLTQMLFAGIDTSTSMLSFALLEFARTPGAWSRLRAELDSKGLLATDPSTWSANQLKECTYLHNSITETLRMYPPIPANTRQAVREHAWLHRNHATRTATRAVGGFRRRSSLAQRPARCR